MILFYSISACFKAFLSNFTHYIFFLKICSHACKGKVYKFLSKSDWYAFVFCTSIFPRLNMTCVVAGFFSLVKDLWYYWLRTVWVYLHFYEICTSSCIRPCLLRCASATAHHHTPKIVLRSVIFSTPKSGKIIHNYIQIHTYSTLEYLA